ncbi:MAG: hypothetical protein ABEJ23_00520 [Haloarculaceae archaeon]
MGLFDLVRSLVGGRTDDRDGETRLGSVARAYVETGAAPDDQWAALEGEHGEIHVLAVVGGRAGGQPSDDDVEAVGTEVRALGGEVVDTAGRGVLLALVPKDRLSELAAYDRIRRLEVTRGPD